MDGLRFVPTLEPQLDDTIEYIPGETKYWAEIIPQHFSKNNEEVLGQYLDLLKPNDCILHVGPNTDQQGSCCSSIMRMKKPETRILTSDVIVPNGEVDPICLECGVTDKQLSLEKAVDWLRWYGQDFFGLIILDCQHSLDKCLKGWELTKLLDSGGVLLLHDTNHRPGPKALYEAVDAASYEKQRHCIDPDDWGISSLKKK